MGGAHGRYDWSDPAIRGTGKVKLSDRTTRALEDLLLVASAFTVLCIGAVAMIVAVKVPKLIAHADVVLSNIDRTVIITGAAATGVQKAEKGQINQLEATQAQLQATLAALRQSIQDTNSNINGNLIPSATRATDSLNGAIQQVNGEVKDVRAAQVRLVADADRNLRTMEETQAKVNRSIDALDIPTLGKNVNLIASSTAETSAHVNKISADAQYEADKFVAPKTTWQKIKGFAAVVGRFGAFVAIKLL